ncbi:hypothetical protein IAT38_007118 [Cryptococcus sp. DSM 104549]
MICFALLPLAPPLAHTINHIDAIQTPRFGRDQTLEDQDMVLLRFDEEEGDSTVGSSAAAAAAGETATGIDDRCQPLVIRSELWGSWAAALERIVSLRKNDTTATYFDVLNPLVTLRKQWLSFLEDEGASFPSLKAPIEAGIQSLERNLDRALMATEVPEIVFYLSPHLKQTWFAQLPDSMKHFSDNAFRNVERYYIKYAKRLPSLADPAASDRRTTLAREKQMMAELNRYLWEGPETLPPVPDEFDDENGDAGSWEKPWCLEWWRDNTANYPILSQMARDYLSAPGACIPLRESFVLAGTVDPVTDRLIPCGDDVEEFRDRQFLRQKFRGEVRAARRWQIRKDVGLA